MRALTDILLWVTWPMGVFVVSRFVITAIMPPWFGSIARREGQVLDVAIIFPGAGG